MTLWSPSAAACRPEPIARALASVVTELRLAKLSPESLKGLAPDLLPMVKAYEAILGEEGLPIGRVCLQSLQVLSVMGPATPFWDYRFLLDSKQQPCRGSPRWRAHRRRAGNTQDLGLKRRLEQEMVLFHQKSLRPYCS